MEESLSDLEQSCLEVDELTAAYVGEELTHIAALSELPPGLPDSPLDVQLPAEAPSTPVFALSCALASTLTGK